MMATQIQNVNFKEERKKARLMTDAALAWSIKDAKEAAEIHDKMDRDNIPNNAGRYWDQVSTYSDELNRRKK